MESVSNDTSEVVEFFEPTSEKIDLWNGRTVTAFPSNHFYKSTISFDFWKMLREFPSRKHHDFNCNVCKIPLVDFFRCYRVEPLDEGCSGYEEGWQLELERAKTVSALFGRTCKNCINTPNEKNIFGTSRLNSSIENYSVPIGLTHEDVAGQDLSEPPELLEVPTFSQRLKNFVDSSGQDLKDINEALISGLFRSFGVVRDSVDFFVVVGDFLKEKVGITKDKERKLLYGGDLEEEAIKCLKEVSKPSNLESFRKIFPTGREIQKASATI